MYPVFVLAVDKIQGFIYYEQCPTLFPGWIYYTPTTVRAMAKRDGRIAMST